MDTDRQPFPVRLIDMEEVEARFVQASEAETASLHEGLPFYALLTVGEAAALERRFPDELADTPDGPKSSPALWRAWDKRARDLVGYMLKYGAAVLAGQFDLVGRVGVDAPVEALALTASGSIIEIEIPGEDGLRTYRYTPSARAGGTVRAGRTRLEADVVSGNALSLDGRKTLEIIVLAAKA